MRLLSARLRAFVVAGTLTVVVTGCGGDDATPPEQAPETSATAAGPTEPPTTDADAQQAAAQLVEEPPDDLCAELGITSELAVQLTGNPVVLETNPTVGQPTCTIDVTERALTSSTDLGAIVRLRPAEALDDAFVDDFLAVNIGDVAEKSSERVDGVGDEAVMFTFKPSAVDDRGNYRLVVREGAYLVVLDHIVFSRNDPNHEPRLPTLLKELAAVVTGNLE